MEYEKYLYDTEQMKADVRTYIADGMNWVNFHIKKIKEQKEKKAEKLTEDMNGFILEAWNKIDYFENVINENIIAAITDLSEEEKQFVINAKELRTAKNKDNTILPKGFNSDANYVRRVIKKIIAAQEQLNSAPEQTIIEKSKEELSKQYLELGRTFIFNKLEPYLDQFTAEEQQYINEGRMVKIGSEYAEGAEKARKFLKTSAAFKKVGDKITQVGVDFNKAMTSKGEELGDKVRQAGVKLSPLIIDLGEDVIEFADNLEIKKDAMFDKLYKKTDDVFAKLIWREIKKHIEKECLKIVPNAPDDAIEIKAKDVYFQSKDYILNEYPILKQKAEEIKENYIQSKGNNFNEGELEAYLSTQIPDFKKYKNFTKYYNDYYDIFVNRTYEYVNS